MVSATNPRPTGLVPRISAIEAVAGHTQIQGEDDVTTVKLTPIGLDRNPPELSAPTLREINEQTSRALHK